MTALIWDQVGERVYEAGVDRGVLYLSDNSGVAWNGLTSVVEDTGGTSVTPLYFDGRKFLDLSLVGDFTGSISAITYPDEFLEYEGVSDIDIGIFVGNQSPKPFGLSYRTLIGNDVDGTDHGYKLHILYDVTAIPESRTFDSLGETFEPIEFGWRITARPQTVPGKRPSAHIIFDSRKTLPGVLEAIENVFYGTELTPPRLPALTELLSLATASGGITIVDNGNGTWSAFGPDSLIIMNDATTFTIEEANATYSDANTYTISSTGE